MRRYWDKVKKTDDCWLWNAGRDAKGYGIFSFNRKSTHAHRVAWQFANGPIPDGEWVLHKCDNPCCVRPDHLFLGSNADNVRDRETKRRHPHKGDNHWAKQYPELVAKGETHPRAKLTERDVLEIRSRGDSESRADLAREFDVTRTHITHIMQRRTWRHI